MCKSDLHTRHQRRQRHINQYQPARRPHDFQPPHSPPSHQVLSAVYHCLLITRPLESPPPVLRHTYRSTSVSCPTARFKHRRTRHRGEPRASPGRCNAAPDLPEFGHCPGCVLWRPLLRQWLSWYFPTFSLMMPASDTPFSPCFYPNQTGFRNARRCAANRSHIILAAVCHAHAGAPLTRGLCRFEERRQGG